MSHLLGDEVLVEEEQSKDPDGHWVMPWVKLLQSTKIWGCKHLCNAAMLLIACGILKGDNMVSSAQTDIKSLPDDVDAGDSQDVPL
eukprot:3085434-Ditylum_brightwellii.AAC.1